MLYGFEKKVSAICMVTRSSKRIPNPMHNKGLQRIAVGYCIAKGLTDLKAYKGGLYCRWSICDVMYLNLFSFTIIDMLTLVFIFILVKDHMILNKDFTIIA